MEASVKSAGNIESQKKEEQAPDKGKQVKNNL